MAEELSKVPLQRIDYDAKIIVAWSKAIEGNKDILNWLDENGYCLLYTSPSPRDATLSRMPSSA